jgi:hypothetical protein
LGCGAWNTGTQVKREERLVISETKEICGLHDAWLGKPDFFLEASFSLEKPRYFAVHDENGF